MSGVVLQEVNEVGDIVQVVDGGDSELLGVGNGGAEQEATDTTEAVNTELY
jgi:hypothetical protein